ncbi:hypothetical protein CRM22_000413 [Opisthorchis felineus]|uniref:Uncharacterized protein n=1 Tax=Opisthorchis felineus TaxID=147828 RepID=A0A4S2MLC8_OPIFE|nr:hypothetical protein CRM22_000413 [Opisthorchis felineus]
MSQSEKFVQGSTEPLVLRPPVGSEVYGEPGVRFRALFNPDGDPRRRRRLLCHCMLSVLLALIAVTVLLFIMFMVGVGPLFPASSQSPVATAYRSQSPYSTCSVLIPVLRVRMTEVISPMDNMFNVTLMGGNTSPGMQTVKILHLCKDGLTVIRDNERCYIRPMRQGWRRLCSDSHMQRVRLGALFRPSIEARLNDERWFIDESPSVPNVINNSYIMAWCEGVPAFRLVSNPPADGYTIYPSSESVPTFVAPPSPEDPDSAEVLDEFLRPSSTSEQHPDALFDNVEAPFIRRTRHLDLSEALGLPPNQLPIAVNSRPSTEKSRTSRRRPRHVAPIAPRRCREVATVLEDATVSLEDEPAISFVARDQIIQCGA